MREFFKGWKRKVGIVTLLLALMFMGAWGRSHISKDQISLWNDGHIRNSIFLNDTGVGFQQMQHNSPFGCFTIKNGVVVPYWPVITSLTLLSTYLLLSKPRQSTLKKITEPAANKGA